MTIVLLESQTKLVGDVFVCAYVLCIVMCICIVVYSCEISYELAAL